MGILGLVVLVLAVAVAFLLWKHFNPTVVAADVAKVTVAVQTAEADVKSDVAKL